jgi:hypothetical protein
MTPFTLARYPGFLLAWADDWPGLVCGAPTEDILSDSVPRSLLEFRSWLEAHGERGPEDVTWHTSESLDGADFDARDACYGADLAPLSRPEFERYLRHVQFAQDDLLRAAELPAALLDWRPEGLAVEHPDPWAPDARTIRGVLTHTLQLEVFYREGLKDGTAAGIFEPVANAAEETARTRAILAGVAENDLSRVFRPRRPSASHGEAEPGEWTLRKALRRIISHNRAHAAEVTQRRTWILLGVPKQTN